MHCCLIYLAKKPLIQQKRRKRQKDKTKRQSCLFKDKANLGRARQDKDKVRRHVLSFVFKISRLLRFKDKTKDMSWKLPGLPASPRSKCDLKTKTRQKITMSFTLSFCL